ncbi:hypothetical protein J2S74_002249 [Evansella vedderi]|uniref:Uncharacterized protein n=1 Tax=Evansella vedderi TaxID=38282 RepID=A0ABT9ZUF1_9BACI|nr:hypothetical protein [Evansella vedderi]
MENVVLGEGGCTERKNKGKYKTHVFNLHIVSQRVLLK